MLPLHQISDISLISFSCPLRPNNGRCVTLERIDMTHLNRLRDVPDQSSTYVFLGTTKFGDDCSMSLRVNGGYRI